MSTKKVACLSQMPTKPGKKNELKMALQALIEPTLQEKGWLS